MATAYLLPGQYIQLQVLTVAIPEAVAKHIHDFQQRLDTLVSGEVIKLEQ